jgi:hypothetical protein
MNSPIRQQIFALTTVYPKQADMGTAIHPLKNTENNMIFFPLGWKIKNHMGIPLLP